MSSWALVHITLSHTHTRASANNPLTGEPFAVNFGISRVDGVCGHSHARPAARSSLHTLTHLVTFQFTPTLAYIFIFSTWNITSFDLCNKMWNDVHNWPKVALLSHRIPNNSIPKQRPTRIFYSLTRHVEKLTVCVWFFYVILSL